MTHQAALGDRDNPMPATSGTAPAVCCWWTDPDGDLVLIPGCMARVNDPDAGCTCDTLAPRLERAEAELRTLRRHHEGLRDWLTAVTTAVGAHPDGVQIMAAAARRATP